MYIFILFCISTLYIYTSDLNSNRHVVYVQSVTDRGYAENERPSLRDNFKKIYCNFIRNCTGQNLDLLYNNSTIKFEIESLVLPRYKKLFLQETEGNKYFSCSLVQKSNPPTPDDSKVSFFDSFANSTLAINNPDYGCDNDTTYEISNIIDRSHLTIPEKLQIAQIVHCLQSGKITFQSPNTRTVEIYKNF